MLSVSYGDAVLFDFVVHTMSPVEMNAGLVAQGTAHG